MRSMTDLAWAAGLLEGEGSFGWINGYPVVTIEMTDRDVIERYAALFPGQRGRKIMARKNKNYTGSGTPRLDSYRYEVQGSLAVSIMMTLFPFMGERRKAKIESILTTWRETPYYQSQGSRQPYKGGKRTAR